MWAIRILTGPKAGQILPLTTGSPKFGRGSSCDLKIASSSISKEHAQFHVTDDKLIVADLKSRNGTFVNGVRVQHRQLKPGDKIAFHDVIFDVLSMRNVQALKPGATEQASYQGVAQQPSAVGEYRLQAAPDSYDPRYQAMMQGSHESDVPAAPQFSANSLPELGRAMQAYIDNVAMPGVYALAKTVPFRYVLAIYVGAFVVLTTLLSTIPMAAITKTSIQAESQRRARTIARNLALVNRQAILEGLDVSVSVQTAETEDGVEGALILAARDGHVIAPVSRAGAYADRPYILRVRKEMKRDGDLIDREYVEQVDSSKIVASVPIKKFNAEGGGQSPVAYAVVVYDMASLAVDGAQTLSLLIQNLAIALGLGLILYFFLSKTIERPILALNEQLDDALREGKDDIYVEFQFPELATLASNINSALSRIGQNHQGSVLNGASANDRDGEAANIIRASVAAALAVSAVDGLVIASNDAFDHLIGGGVDLRRKPVTEIADQALQAQLRDLIDRLRANPREPAFDELPFPDGRYSVSGAAVMGQDEPAYWLIVLNKIDGDA